MKQKRRLHSYLGKLLLLLTFTSLLLLSPGQASADLALKSIHFDLAITQPGSASISYGGGSTDPLTGTGISIDRVVGINTTQGVLQAVSNGFMSFTTGNLLNFSTSGGVSTWTFDKGGSITLTGGISNLGIANGSTLFTGTFTDIVVISVPVYGSMKFHTAVAAFGDVKNSTLATYYGFADGLKWAGNFNISYYATQQAGGALQSTQVLTGDITNTPVPIPAAAWLLGSGLLGLVALRRKRAN